MKRRVPIVELAICCFAVAVQIVAAILVRRTFLHREPLHDVPPALALASSWAWAAVGATAVLTGVLALARPPQWVWSALASLACIAAIALYVCQFGL